MKSLFATIHGDKTMWAVIALLALFSFMPVYSASTNLVYTIGVSNKTTYFLFKHAVHISLGLMIAYGVHRIDYRYSRLLGIVGLPLIAMLLIYTLVKGNTIGGANASRWVNVFGMQFQPSSIAAIVLLIYVAQYLAKIKDTVIDFKSSFIELWLPVGFIVLLILPANFSTAAIIFAVVSTLLFVGKYPLKYLGIVFCMGAMVLGIFILAAKAFPDVFPHRVDTWVSRIDRFVSPDKEDQDLYQVENAKIAIATGGLFGLGPGKSVQKNFLPQSSSDFIYAIIVEEYGLVMGIVILSLYLILFYRFIVAAHKSTSLYGKLLVVGLGFFFTVQALINMGVAVSLLPTTGQPLPLISSGGTSIWMICIALGVIISVTRKEEEIKEVELRKTEDEKRLQEMLAEQLKLKKEDTI